MGAAGSARAGADDVHRNTKIAALYQELGVSSLPDARRAAFERRLRDLYADRGGDALWLNGPEGLRDFEAAARGLLNDDSGDEPPSPMHSSDFRRKRLSYSSRPGPRVGADGTETPPSARSQGRRPSSEFRSPEYDPLQARPSGVWNKLPALRASRPAVDSGAPQAASPSFSKRRPRGISTFAEVRPDREASTTPPWKGETLGTYSYHGIEPRPGHDDTGAAN